MIETTIPPELLALLVICAIAVAIVVMVAVRNAYHEMEANRSRPVETPDDDPRNEDSISTSLGHRVQEIRRDRTSLDLTPSRLRTPHLIESTREYVRKSKEASVFGEEEDEYLHLPPEMRNE